MHYPAPRAHGDDRGSPALEKVASAAYNEALQIYDHLAPVRSAVFALWGLAIGSTGAPGLAVLTRDLLSGRRAAWSKFSASQRGRAAAWRTHLAARPTPAALASGTSSLEARVESSGRAGVLLE
jgi:hypothetical protein